MTWDTAVCVCEGWDQTLIASLSYGSILSTIDSDIGSGSGIKSYRDIQSHFDILKYIGVGIGINFDESALSSAQGCYMFCT